MKINKKVTEIQFFSPTLYFFENILRENSRKMGRRFRLFFSDEVTENIIGLYSTNVPFVFFRFIFYLRGTQHALHKVFIPINYICLCNKECKYFIVCIL